MQDLAPTIYRQRMIIEGTRNTPLTGDDLTLYLTGLSEALGMKTLNEPVTHLSETYGWAGWIHSETSGCHVYAWDKPEPFFSADIYTCKKFDEQAALDFTQKALNPIQMVSRSV